MAVAGYIRVPLTDGRWVTGRSGVAECVKAGRCVCGFCKGEGQCDFGDCANPLPSAVTHKVGTLCLECSQHEWRFKLLRGHRPSVPLVPVEYDRIGLIK